MAMTRQSAGEGALLVFSLAALGVVVGALTVALDFAVDGAAAVFGTCGWLGWLLPVAGFATFGAYRALRLDFSWSTAQVMEAVRDGRPVPAPLAPAIIVGTSLTVLCGGSVGKEAAALQMGAAASEPFRRFLPGRLSRLLPSAALAAALGAMLDAPLAGAVFSFEALRRRPQSVADVFAPVVTALVAWGVTEAAGVRFLVAAPLALDAAALGVAGGAALAGGLAAGLLALLFCRVLLALRKGLARLGAPVFALAVGGVATALVLGYAELFHYEGLRAFCGTGAAQISVALSGGDLPWAFAMKAALTLLTLAGGFKGGEIMPVLAIGACLGVALADGAAALGATEVARGVLAVAVMAAFFAGCTNCPLTAGMFVLELLGPWALAVSAPAVTAAFLVARSTSLYPTSLPHWSTTPTFPPAPSGGRRPRR